MEKRTRKLLEMLAAIQDRVQASVVALTERFQLSINWTSVRIRLRIKLRKYLFYTLILMVAFVIWEIVRFQIDKRRYGWRDPDIIGIEGTVQSLHPKLMQSTPTYDPFEPESPTVDTPDSMDKATPLTPPYQ